jgi:hypothetical protein
LAVVARSGQAVRRILNPGRGNHNLRGLLCLLFPDQTEQAKRRRPKDQEAQQWFGQQPVHGVHQIGDV